MPQDTIEQLQNGWYNALCTGLNLSPESFQTVQASLPLSNTSQGIWKVFNSIPPLSLTNVFSSSTLNNFYDDYVTVINTILPQGSGRFEEVMADQLVYWNAYKKDLKPGDIKNAGGLYELFVFWADTNLNATQAAKAKPLYKQLLNGVVLRAVDDANNPDYLDPNMGPRFMLTIDEVRTAVAKGASKSVSFNSSHMNSDVSHTWAKGQIGIDYSFFSLSAGASYDKLSEKITSSQVDIQAKFEHVVSLSAPPDKWYHSAALNLAYKAKDGSVWPLGQHPTWDETFGFNGNMQRFATEIVVVDGVDVTITVANSFDSKDVEEIKAQASVGYWPFFSFNGDGGHTTDVRQSDKGFMEIKIKSPAENPLILGVNVLPIGAVVTD